MKRSTLLKIAGAWCKLHYVFGLNAPGRAAFKIFTSAPRLNITEKQQSFLATAHRTDLEFEGKRIAVYQWGDLNAPYVYSAYGWGYNAGRWRHFAPQLVAAGLRFVAVDFPGHGNSARTSTDFPMISRLHQHMLMHFGKPKLSLTHSFGAATFIDALTKVDRSLHPERAAFLASFSNALILFKQFTDALGFSKRGYESFCRAVQHKVGITVHEFDLAERAARLSDLKTLIAHDPEDEITTFANAERLHAHWPNSLLYPSVKSGHGFTEQLSTSKILGWLVNEAPIQEAVLSPAQADIALKVAHPLKQAFKTLESTSEAELQRTKFYD